MDRPLQDLPQIQIPLTRPQDTGQLKITHHNSTNHILVLVNGHGLGLRFSYNQETGQLKIKPPNKSESNQRSNFISLSSIPESDLVLALDSRLYDRQAR